MKERIVKTLLSIILVPFLMVLLIILSILMPLIPIIVFIWPHTLKIKNEK